MRRLTESALTGAADLKVPLTISVATGAELGRGQRGLTGARGRSLAEQLLRWQCHCPPAPVAAHPYLST